MAQKKSSAKNGGKGGNTKKNNTAKSTAKKTAVKKETTEKKNGGKKTDSAKKTAAKEEKPIKPVKEKKHLSPAAFEAVCIVAAGFAALVIFSLFFAYDTVFGEIMLMILKGLFGTGAYIFPFGLMICVIGFFMMENREKAGYKAILCSLFFAVFISLLHILVVDADGFDFERVISGFTDTDYMGGGLIGGLIGEVCLLLFKKTGSVIIFLTLMAALLVLISGKSVFKLFSDFWYFTTGTLMGGFYADDEEYDEYEDYDEYDDEYYEDERAYEEYAEPKEPKRPKKKAAKKEYIEENDYPEELDYYEKLRREKSYKNAEFVNLKKKSGEKESKKGAPDIMANRVVKGQGGKKQEAKSLRQPAEESFETPEFLKKERRERDSSEYVPEFLRNKRKPERENNEGLDYDEEAFDFDYKGASEEIVINTGAEKTDLRDLQSEVIPEEREAAEEAVSADEKAAGAEDFGNEAAQKSANAGKTENIEKAEVSEDTPPWDISLEEHIVPQEFKDRVKVVEGEAETVKKLSQKPKAQYKYPKLSFLEKNPDLAKQDNRDELIKNSHILEETLKSFKVSATVVEVSQGPTVTRYELVPAVGTKVKSIANLDKDLAMRLAAENIMIEAPIPGKTAVGIEIPNENPTTVCFSEVVASKKFQASKSKLTFALGKDVAGNVIVKDIAKAPHFLIAGATNSGKSVCINTLINCLLYKATPDEVRLIMVDPKMVELNVYNGIPHLLIPVVTDPHKASAALNWACTEMMRRYKLCADVGVRNLDEYNEYLKKQGEKQLYKIVIIIDELADLMLVAKKEVEGHIQRLTQLARAAGIHLIVATQRPSSDVITGVIKSNIPSRIAFSVAQAINSRIILDEAGAEKLIGKGDMLLKTVEMDRVLRVQGAFISNAEIKRIVDFIKTDEPNYDPEIIRKIENPDEDEGAQNGGGTGGGNGSDALIDDVIAYIVRTKKASTSLIQRQFQIGYNRAARIIDELEERGIIGPENGSKPRVVLMDKEEWRDYSERRRDYI